MATMYEQCADLTGLSLKALAEGNLELVEELQNQIAILTEGNPLA